jgi:tRNA G26 N,N-dimethylase Trm1
MADNSVELTVSQGDTNRILWTQSAEPWHVIDLDPYGSVA